MAQGRRTAHTATCQVSARGKEAGLEQIRNSFEVLRQPVIDLTQIHSLCDWETPNWAKEIDCESWGQFFLKYVLSHPAVTCVIPATASPKHMSDSLGAGRGKLPDEKLRT